MSVVSQPHRSGWRTPAVVIVAGCLIAMIGFGVRSSFGLFLEPMTTANDWDRQTFSLAMAIQNLLWGIGLPVAGALADKFGPRWVIAGGAVVYALGTWGMAVSTSAMALYLLGGLLAGIGVAFTAFSLAMAAMAKVVGPERRSLALGLGTAAGSAGQVVFSPLGQAFISAVGWQTALVYMACFSALILLLAFALPNDTAAEGEPDIGQTLGEAFREAVAHRGYVLLTTGFFVCGFQVSFMTVHFPAYVQDLGQPAYVGAWCLSLVGMFNIIGSFSAGVFGQKQSKKFGLAWIYFLRSVAVIALLLLPKTEINLYLFASAIGLLWLSTVPLTTGIVAQVFGARYMAMLFGIVFLSHQVGSFIGVWLGGYLYDTTGSYDVVWWLCIALGFAAAIIHLPIDDKPLARLSPAPAE